VPPKFFPDLFCHLNIFSCAYESLHFPRDYIA
jgi:hypothetical protein